MGSSRLPGKTLMSILGKPLLLLLLERLERCRELDRIIVATTTKEEDEAIVALCQARSIDYFRGDEANVLNRYYECAREFQLEAVVRFTADNPLTLVVPTLGHSLRAITGLKSFQFLPLLLGFLFALGYWYKNRERFSWRHAFSPVLLVTMITAGFAWPADQVILLVPVIELLRRATDTPGRRSIFIIVGLIIIQCGMGFELVFGTNIYQINGWVPFAIAGLWYMEKRLPDFNTL